MSHFSQIPLDISPFVFFMFVLALLLPSGRDPMLPLKWCLFPEFWSQKCVF